MAAKSSFEELKREANRRSSGKSTFKELKEKASQKRYSEDVGKVDDTYINTFIDDANNYFTESQKALEGINWESATSTASRDTRYSRTQDLGYRANLINYYLENNKDRFDNDTYTSLSKALSDYKSGFSQLDDAFDQYGKYYSQWDSDEEYQTAVRYDGYNKKYAGLDGEGIQKSLDELGVGEEKDWLRANRGTIFGDTIRKNTDFWDYVNTGSKLSYTDFGEETTHKGKSRRQRAYTSIDKYFAASLALAEHYGDDAPIRYDQYDSQVAIFRTMEDQEFENLAYCIAYDKEHGTNMAEQYVDFIEEDLSERRGTEIGKKVTSIDIPVIEDLAVMGYGAIAGVDNFAFGLEQRLSDKELAYYPSQYANSYISDSLDGVGYYAHSAATNIGNMAPSILVSATLSGLGVPGKISEAAGSATMGVSASGNAYKEALMKGYDQESARTYGDLVGASEGLLQYLIGGVSSLGGMSSKLTGKIAAIDNALLRGAAKFGTKLISEITEEELQNYLEPAFRTIIFEEEYDAPTIDELIETAIVTALSTGVLEAGGTVGETKAESALYKQMKQQYGEVTGDLIQEGLLSDPKSESYKLAQKYQKKTEKGKAMTGYQIRSLVEANEAQFAVEDFDSAVKAAKAQLTELGETKDVGKIAKLVAKRVTGQELTRAEKSTLARSQFGAQVAKEMTTPAEEAKSESKPYDTKYEAITYKSITDRVGEESHYGVSENGQTTLRSNEKGESEPIQIKEVTRIEDGELYVSLEDGREAYAGDIDFANESESQLYSAVAEMENITPAAATALVKNYDASAEMSVTEYVNGVDEAYTYGYHGYSVEDMKSGDYAPKLSSEQMMSAYKLGQSARTTGIQNQNQQMVKMRTAAEATVSKKEMVQQQKARFDADAEVYFMNGATVTKFDETGGGYDEKRMAGVNAARVLSKMGIGKKYYFYKSYQKGNQRYYVDENGVEKLAPNGIYKTGTGIIYIDLNAGKKGQGVTLYTMGHELGHFVKDQSESQFQRLANLVTEAYSKTDRTMHQRVVEKQNQLSEVRGEHVTYDEAYEEVVCDALSTMIADGSFYEKVAEIKVKDRKLYNTIKKFFQKLVERFKDVYDKLAPDQQDARDIQDMKEMFDKIQTAFAEALVEASDNFQASETVLAQAGIAVDASTDAGSLYSVRDVLNEADRNKVAKALADRFEVTEKEAKEWLKAETSLASLILNPKYSAYLDYEGDPNEVAIKQNSDYPQGTVDFSNICKKRREFTQVMNSILRNFPNHVFAATDLAKIRTIMGEEGMTLPCGICYVEDRRQLDTIVAQDFINGLQLYRDGSKTRPDGKPFNANQLKGLKLTDGDDYVPSIYELVSLEGRNSLKAKNPNMEAAWVRYNNARGMQAVRLLTNEAEYKRQILKYNKNTVKSKNDRGGLRIYSFSDAEMFHLIDIIQVITDSAAVGLSLQGYTKVNEYAKAVKDTGEKLNRSLIPRGDLGYHMENGKVVLDYDTVEGIDIYSKDFFDNKDNPNVGNITIGINDVQIRASMASDFVDQIIPFHTGQSEEVLGEKGIAAWNNYKDYQTEKDIETGKTSDHQVNIYTEVFQAAEQEGKPIQNKRQFVEKFLQVCKENGLQPRFSQFLNVDSDGNYVYTEGYHKFLVDFKTFAQTKEGEYLPQMPVKPIFDDAYITGLLEAYVKEQQAKDAEVAKQMPKVIERITNEIVKPADGEKTVDFSSAHGENKLTNNQVRGERNDNRGIREATTEGAGSSQSNWGREPDGRKDSNHPGTAQADKGWKKISSAVRTRLVERVDGYVAESKNYEEIFSYLCSMVGATEDDITVSQLKKATRQLTEELYTDAITSHPVLFENRWGFIGEGVSKLRRDILEIANGEEKHSDRYSERTNAPVFYSQMGKVVEGMKQEKFGASSVISMLRGRGVKAEEIRWSGIQAFLEGKKSVTKAELLDFINGSMLHIEETLLDNAETGERSKLPDNYRLEETEDDFGDPLLNLYIDDELRDTFRLAADDSIESTGNSNIWAFNEDDLTGQILNHYAGMGYDEAYVGIRKNTHWDGYKLDGGSNYRELVFKMPGTDYTNRAMKAHWGDDAQGVLAHARMQDFEADGKKMLFIEEIQSDWHNEGHRSGYGETMSAEERKRIKDDILKKFVDSDVGKDIVNKTIRYWGLYSEAEAHTMLTDDPANVGAELIAMYPYWMTEERTEAIINLQEQFDKLDRKKAADAPFKDNYHEYVLKRLIRMAAEEGYDSIGWTTADIQSNRWSGDYAEGYRIEYDQDIPKFLKKYGKQWGAEVGKTPLPGLDGGETYYDVNREETFDSFAEWKNVVLAQLKRDGVKARDVVFEKEHGSGDFIAYDDHTGTEYDRAKVNKQSDTVWAMDITPAMKKSVLEEGQAMYSDRINTDGMSAEAKKIISNLELRAKFSRYSKGEYASYSTERIERELYRSSATKMDYAKSYIAWVNPQDFLYATTTSDADRSKIEKESSELDLERLRKETQPIHLTVDFETGKIVGHEGRHRMVALDKAGVEKVAVIFDAWNDDRHNTKPVDMMRIGGQEFDKYHSGLEFYVHDMLPLSKRYADAARKLFSNVNGSIKFSERTGEDVSNRHLLANAFEGITQNSEEYKMIQEYKDHIKVLNKLDAQLSDVNDQIYKMLFDKTVERDPQKLKELQDKAKAIAHDINRHDKRLLNLESAEPLRKVIDRERKKAAQKTKSHVQEIIQNKKARAEQTELRHKIRKTIRDLNKILNRGNKQRNVKEDMKGFVSKALELADYIFTDHISNDELIRRGIDPGLIRGEKEARLVKETEEILAKLDAATDIDNPGSSLTDEEFARLDAKRKANEEQLRDLLKAQRNQRLSTPVYQLFDDLVTEYASLKNSSQDAVKAAYNEELEKSLRAFMGDDERVNILKNMRVADMTTEELNWLLRAYTMVLTNVRKANEFFVKGMNETIEQKVARISQDFGSRKIPDKEFAIAVQKVANKIGWDYEKLYYALDRIGSEAFTELIMNIANSENIVMQDIMEAVEFRDKIVEKYGFNNWDVNKKIDREFLDNTGKKFTLTLGELMSLYAYSRRKGAWDHIEYGGFVFGKAALTNPKPADSYKLNQAQCEAITSLLTKEQKGYAEEMQKFLSETMGEKGNEVSMMLYGIKMFGEKNYFPIHVAGAFMAKAQESQAQAAAGFKSMSNAGFTHAQNPSAKAPFVLEAFNDVWSDHVNEMSRYHGTVPALEDLRRVMNRSTYSNAESNSVSIKQQMINSYGEEAAKYFDNLYREANSGAITDKLQATPKKLLSLFRKNSVAYSLSVLIQQPTSIVRAYAMIDRKYFGFKGVGAITSGVTKAVTSKWNKAYANAYNEMLKYAPGVTLTKEIGGFDTATGGSIRSYLMDTGKSMKQKLKTGTTLEKGKAVLDVVDDNAIANLPNVADKVAWIEIWNACKREAVARNKSLRPGSEEFMQAVGKRFTEVIRATQVYDSIFAKSPMLKSKNLAVQYLVSFMNEPNTVANMAEKAVRDITQGNWKQGTRAIHVLIHSIIFTNLLKSLVYAMRDDDEDESYIEKYIEAVVGNMMSDFNALNYIPIARDVMSLAQGYDVERADMAIFADTIDAVEKVVKYATTDTEDMTEEQLIELDKKQTEAGWKLAESLAAFIGIPVKNIRREVNGVIDHMRIAQANAGTATKMSISDKVYDAVVESIPFMGGGKSKQDKIYDAIMSGDKAYAGRIRATYKTEDSYHTAVRKALRENDSRIKEAAMAQINGNPSERVRIAKQIIADGFELDDVITAINSEINALTEDDSSDTKKVKGYYKMEDFVKEAANGDTASLSSIREDILQTEQANGKTKDEAEEDFASNVKSKAKEVYLEGALSDSTTLELLTKYAEMDEAEAAEKVSYWAFCKAHPDSNLSEANVDDYIEFAEPAQIPLAVFEQYLEGTADLKTIRDEWGDEVKSKREQVLEVIDSLDLTWQQKDALYLAAGYAESKIWDVPW